MRNFIIILVLFSVASCNISKNIATKYFDNHGFEAANYFSENFPITEDTFFIKGHSTHVIDTTTKNDTTYIHSVDTIIKQVTRYVTIRDTTIRLDTLKIIKVDSSKLYILSLINERKTKDSIILQTKYVDAKQKAKTRGMLMWGTWILIAVVVGLGVFFKIRVGALKSVIDKIKSDV